MEAAGVAEEVAGAAASLRFFEDEELAAMIKALVSHKSSLY